jgi:hypothetical protein
MSLNAQGCFDAVDGSLYAVRSKAQDMSDAYSEEFNSWVEDTNQYLSDLQDYLDGILDTMPEEVRSPPAAPATDEFPTPADYHKAFGDAFLKYICDNVEVEFSWDGEATSTSSGSTVYDSSYPDGFSVSGASGGGTLAGPTVDDSPNLLKKFLENLSSLVSGLEVTLPVVPGAQTFSPSKVKFASGAKLEAGDNLMLVTPKPSKDNPSYEATLLNLCDELVASFKANFKSSTSAQHVVTAQAPALSEGFFSGNVEMVSIS